MKMKIKFLLTLVALFSVLATIPSTALAPYTAKLKAPTIIEVSTPSHDKIVVKYKKDSAQSKLIRAIHYSMVAIGLRL